MDDSTPPNKKGCGGCLVPFVPVFVLLLALFTINALTPYLREPRSITVTVLDEAQQPVPDATIDFQEYEWVLYIPPLTFASPSHLIDRRRTVTTDASGNAEFTVKLNNADAHGLSRAGKPLTVVYYQTDNTFRGPGERFAGGGLPQWGAIDGFPNVTYKSTIVVSAQQPK